MVLGEVTVSPCPAGFDELGVVFTDAEHATVLGGGAAFADGTTAAAKPEGRAAVGRDGDGVAGWTGCGAGLVIDAEVVAVEPAGDRFAERDRLDRHAMSATVELDSHLCGPVGGVGEDLQTAFLLIEQRQACRAARSVGSGEHAGVDTPGLGFDRSVSPVSVTTVWP